VTGWETLASYRAKVATLALSLIEGSTFAYAIYKCVSSGDCRGRVSFVPPNRFR
jgi:hypothetical protein